MADVRCPMCGKPNPEGRDTCQFCDARLKPLIINQPESESAAGLGDLQASPKMDDYQDETQDWLASLQSSQEPEAPQSATGGDFPDWLSDMRSDLGESAQPSEEEKHAAPEEMDWMSRLGESVPVEEPPPVSDAPEIQPPKRVSSGMTDWFKSLSEEEKEPTGEKFDWLSEPEAETPQPASAETPDLLDRLGGESQESTGEALPDWLSEPKAEAPQPASAEMPGWQDSLGAESPEPAGEVLPDWLSEPEAEAPQPVSGEEPDWLKDFEAGTEEPAGEALSGWLADMKSEPEKAATHPEGEAETFDWLSQFEIEEPSTVVEPPLSWKPKPSELISPVEEELGPEQAGEAGPDWLKELETNFAEMPDAQVEIPPLPITPPEKPSSSPFILEDTGQGIESVLPDWLTETASEEAQQEIAEAAAPDLSPGDLPGWLEAMRPVEALGVPEAAGVADLPVEGAGPLAGLRGVLPAEPDVAHVRKPPVYSVKLQVSDIQQANADLLEQIVNNEGEAQPVPGRPVITSQHVLRILIGVVLTFSILAPLLLGIPVMEPPGMNPDVFVGEYLARQTVESLSPGQPVLLVVDYEPGFSGEMEAAAGAVLDHLSLKGIYLTLVSTTPSGPILAERLVAAVKMSQENYQNLGFVSGGTSGLLSFIENPRNTLPVAWNGEAAWEAPALQNVNSLENFALIIVATESAEAGRAWIEQAHPRLNGKPMLLVISAQIDPLMRPYFEANPRQVQGLVSGLAGGAAYESSFGRAGSASTHWSAFSVGLLMACFLVILGGALNATTAIMASSKKTIGKEG